MSYTINDQALIEEIRQSSFIKQMRSEAKLLGFEHPLDSAIMTRLARLTLNDSEIQYTEAKKMDELWHLLLKKAIICLRFFDKREPFLNDSSKKPEAYGMDELRNYYRRYTDFESIMYGANSHYRDHVFHAVRVWLLGIVCMIKAMPIPSDETDISTAPPFINNIELDGGADAPGDLNFFEKVSMWTIIALCHDLGYPLEKANQILNKTKNMMQDFVPNPNLWSDFSYRGVQDNINEYILRFISTKMVAKTPNPVVAGDSASVVTAAPNSVVYHGRIQPKYYLKFAKSLENLQHGIISSVIIFKLLVYFLESDFSLNDDYTFGPEDARQFYIRREILRSIASHTCPDTYNIHLNTFSSFLFLCDELQEWGRKSWKELYTGASNSSVTLELDYFTSEGVMFKETIQTNNDDQVVIASIQRIFSRQYSLYRSTFRDGQTSTRNFTLNKTIDIIMPPDGTDKKDIHIEFALPTTGRCTFKVDLSRFGNDINKRDTLKKDINKGIHDKDYSKEVSYI